METLSQAKDILSSALRLVPMLAVAQSHVFSSSARQSESTFNEHDDEAARLNGVGGGEDNQVPHVLRWSFAQAEDDIRRAQTIVETYMDEEPDDVKLEQIERQSVAARQSAQDALETATAQTSVLRSIQGRAAHKVEDISILRNLLGRLQDIVPEELDAAGLPIENESKEASTHSADLELLHSRTDRHGLSNTYVKTANRDPDSIADDLRAPHLHHDVQALRSAIKSTLVAASTTATATPRDQMNRLTKGVDDVRAVCLMSARAPTASTKRPLCAIALVL